MEQGNINGYELVVTEAGGGNFGDGPEMDQTEWYLSIVKKIDKVESTNAKFGPQFTFVFEVQGEQFQIEIGGKPAQHQVRGNTSLICSKDPSSGKMSKFYDWYSKIMGAEPATGHRISTKDLIGKSVFVMVKANKGVKDPTRTYYNVVMVKSATKAAVKPVAQIPSVKSIVKGKPPVPVVSESSDVDSGVAEMQAFETTPVVKKSAAKKADVFSDVFAVLIVVGLCAKTFLMI